MIEEKLATIILVVLSLFTAALFGYVCGKHYGCKRVHDLDADWVVWGITNGPINLQCEKFGNPHSPEDGRQKVYDRAMRRLKEKEEDYKP